MHVLDHGGSAEQQWAAGAAGAKAVGAEGMQMPLSWHKLGGWRLAQASRPAHSLTRRLAHSRPLSSSRCDWLVLSTHNHVFLSLF